jgi:D-xylose 1-dehydrogenase (NADP+, D-xylono-1,5-lactone-forming)
MRLGLLSTAHINRRILPAAAASDAVEVVGVASRSAERAEAYAREHGLARAHGCYDELLADPEVDAVYIGLPNALHVPWTLRALDAGKHVLVEKPLAARPEDVERCFDAAEARGLVLTEGFMWRHHPQADRFRERVAGGEIGELRLVRATFSFPLDRPGDPRWDPALDGGALMDVGCYCVSGSRLLAGSVLEARAIAVRSASGVDRRFAATLAFAGDVVAQIDCGLDLPAREGLEAVGADGVLALTDPWLAREPRIELRRDGGVEVEEAERANPYQLELEDLAAAAAGERAPRLGREDAVDQARGLATVRAAAHMTIEMEVER